MVHSTCALCGLVHRTNNAYLNESRENDIMRFLCFFLLQNQNSNFIWKTLVVTSLKLSWALFHFFYCWFLCVHHYLLNFCLWQLFSIRFECYLNFMESWIVETIEWIMHRTSLITKRKEKKSEKTVQWFRRMKWQILILALKQFKYQV